MGYAPLIKSQRIRLFNGLNWYVNGTDGKDTNSGVSPEKAFKTIGAATAYLVANSREGDRINVFAGTYEENVVLSKNATELFLEIGTILDGDGTCLTVSGNYCRVEGPGRCTSDADQIGVLVSGEENYLRDIKVTGTASTKCFHVTGNINSLIDCRGSGVKAGGKVFDIDGGRVIVERGIAGGTTTSYGFYVNTGNVFGGLLDCLSIGNQTSGFYCEDSATGWSFVRCVSGVGDGPRHKGSSSNTWSQWSFEDTVYADATITAESGAQVLSLFKVTGSVLIREVTGVVTTAITAGVTTVQLVLQDTGTTVQITKNDGVLSSMPIGTLLAKTGNVGATIEIESAATCAIMDEVNPKRESFRATQMTPAADVLTRIQMLLTTADAAQSGVIRWRIKYEQISEGSFLEVA